MSEKRKDNKGRVLKTGESQRKDGRYQYRYVTLGNQRRTVYAPTLAELREKEARISEMQKAGVDYQESLIDVKTLLQRYIDLKLFAKVNTLKRYTYTLRKISRYPISDMPISRCTKSDVKKLLITWQSEGLCYETILHYLSFMDQAFQVAVDDGILKVNPCKFDLRDVIPEQQKPVKTLPSEQQLASWLGYVYGNKVYRNKYDIYVVLLYTGLRVSSLWAAVVKVRLVLTSRKTGLPARSTTALNREDGRPALCLVAADILTPMLHRWIKAFMSSMVMP